MNYRILLAATLGALALGACSKDKPAAALNCSDPTVATTVQQQLQQAITQSARQFAQTDSRQFIDADKIIAAVSQLNVSLADAKEDSSGSKAMCSAQLNITSEVEKGSTFLCRFDANHVLARTPHSLSGISR